MSLNRGKGQATVVHTSFDLSLLEFNGESLKIFSFLGFMSYDHAAKKVLFTYSHIPLSQSLPLLISLSLKQMPFSPKSHQIQPGFVSQKLPQTTITSPQNQQQKPKNAKRAIATTTDFDSLDLALLVVILHFRSV